MKKLLQHWVTQQAERHPDAIAVVMDQERLTYRQLEEEANQLARLLEASGCVKGDRVCFLMPKSPAAIVSILGILKADCMHVPLDPGSPAARLSKIVESCESRCILAAGSVGNLLDELVSQPKFRESITIGGMDERITGRNFRIQVSMRDLARYSSAPFDSRNTP